MKRPDEKEVIRIFQDKLRSGSSEDVELFSLGGAPVAFNIDTLVQSTDVPPGFELAKIAEKSVVACASDFAAKGIRPEFGFVSVVIPDSFSRGDIAKLARGLAGASKKLGFRILGGDTNGGAELSISVCLVGAAKSAVKRGTAKNGDAVFVTGPFGYTGAGLAIMLDNKKAGRALRDRAKRAVFSPPCRLEFGIAARDVMTASMDSSDGLSRTLHEIAGQSNKSIIVECVPAKKDVLDFARQNKMDFMDPVFYGGEEYELVFTVRQKHRRRVIGIAKRLGVPAVEIGTVLSGDGVRLADGSEIRDGGWRHLGPKPTAGAKSR